MTVASGANAHPRSSAPIDEPSRRVPISADEVRDAVREARDSRTPLRIVGRGHWLDAGRPVDATRLLVLGSLTGIADYTPGDLTLTAHAGTPLSEIARITATEGQWLALDPFGDPDGSIGATIATASAGPLAHAFGTPRDAVLGLELITGSGDRIRTGGRVVKNVAGFDLTRLFTGSWGTLGAITGVTVRLRALPLADETYVLNVPDAPDSLGEMARALRGGALAASAIELVNGELAGRLVVGRGDCMLVRLGGNASAVGAQREWLGRLGPVAPVPVSVWRVLRGVEAGAAAVARCSSVPSRIGTLWRHARQAAAHFTGAMLHGSVERGVVRCVIPLGAEASVLGAVGTGEPVGLALVHWLRQLGEFDGSVIVERVPAAIWKERPPGPLSRRLEREVKLAYDPDGILNPGIMGRAT